MPRDPDDATSHFDLLIVLFHHVMALKSQIFGFWPFGGALHYVMALKSQIFGFWPSTYEQNFRVFGGASFHSR